MKVLFFSNLYPNSEEPTRATYNKQKIESLRKLCEVEVVAPVPWFPLKSMFAKNMSCIPAVENIDGLKVYHPRVFYIPKLFRFAYGMFYYLSLRRFIKDLYKEFKFDIILSAWVYPDGFAAMELARLIKKPFVVLAHGSDVHVHIDSFLRRGLMKKTFQRAGKVIAVSKELKDHIIKLGISDEKTTVIYDGIDHNLFFPIARAEARNRLGILYDGKMVLFVGNLVGVKGLETLLKAAAFSRDKDWKLFIVGSGYLERDLKKTIKDLKLDERVAMVGSSAHAQVPIWMSAADLLCLPSLAEGLPCVILEAFGCGLPVVASRVGGIPEILDGSRLGLFCEPGDANYLSDAIDKALSKKWDREYIRAFSFNFSWEKNSREILKTLEAACARKRR